MKLNKILSTIVLVLMVISCSKNKTNIDDLSDKNQFLSLISNVTSGVISKKDEVRIVLVKPVAEWSNNTVLNDSYFSITPKTKGKWIALNNRTISFQPETTFAPDMEYVFAVKLNKFLKTPSELETFSFKVKTIKQDFIVSTNTLQSYNKNWQYLLGTVKTSDVVTFEEVKQLVSATQKGKKLQIKFDEIQNPSKFFNFTIDSIQRFEDDGKIEINYNGSVIGVNQKDSYLVNIIGKNNFQVIDVSVNNSGKQYIEINFSDPLQKSQNFKGLVILKGTKRLKYVVNGNVLKVFPQNTLKGVVNLEVFQGIKSDEGYKLKDTYTQQIAFEQIKPEIKLLHNGTILPTSENVKFNFEAINLKAVDVTVFKIYQNNVLQFLQENSLKGQRNLRQVSRPIAKKTINLQQKSHNNLTKWNAFAINLNSIINSDPGAIYRVELSFKKSYSLYKCEGEDTAEVKDETINYDEEAIEDSYWDFGSAYYENSYYDYDWRERDNPCHNTYYRNKKVSANVLASNLGVTVKKGLNNSYFVAVADLLTTQSVANATVKFYNFQQQEMGVKTTDATGIVFFNATKPAFFAIVSKNKQSTYIKLADGNALSMSKYQVSGVQLKKGLKGFIYGERGVWRPGDSLFLSFMLNDKANVLPKGHPVKIELSNPEGTVVHREIKTDNLNNFYRFTIPTDADAVTGNWQAKVSVGGTNFSKSIKIETIKPNRLKIKVGFDTAIITSKKPVQANLEVLWLHGAIAKNLKTDVNVKFYQQKTVFKQFPNYEFDDPARSFSADEQTIYKGKINAEGKAKFTVNPQINSKSPGMLKASFVTKVYENGGDFSTDVFSKTYSPYTSYVGLSTPKGDRARNMLLTDTPHRFDVATVDENGKPIAVRNLEVKIYKVNHSWWWDTASNNLSQYDGRSYKQAIFAKTIATNSKGKATFNFELKYPDWGRFLVRIVNKKSGHATGKMIFVDWPGWAGKARKGNPDEATMLVFTADNKKYNVGETATVTIPTTAGSKALVTIENGTEVLESHWVNAQKGNTQFSFKVTQEMAPNVYISISAIQQHSNTKNDLPIRRYGVTGILVENIKTRLYPQIEMPNVLAPEAKVMVKVKEQTGKPMTYSIAVVDEGLLDLTRFKTPNPWSSFYAKQALGVKTWDIYDDVVGAYGGNINQVFSIGGDGMLAGSKNKKANRFKPVVIYLGPFELKANQTKTHQIQLPKYVGSVRTMVVAHNPDMEAYGNIEKTTPVRKPLMLLASMPRKVTSGEKMRLPITVFAMENKVKNVTVKLKPNSIFKVIGETTKQLHFNQPDEKMVYFDIEVLKNGLGNIEVLASGNGEKASYTIAIDAINPNIATTDVKTIILESNSTQTISFETFGITGTNTASVELSSLPTMDFNTRLQYLIRYPHGCVEQTTSSVFPQLFLNDIFDLSSEKKNKIQFNVQNGIDRLAHFQMANGGFSYWRGGNTANDWSSSYAGHFLIEAEKKGFVLPISFKSKWISYQRNAARNWRLNTQKHSKGLAQAYRLYTLALAGSADLSSMNRLRETKGINNESKLRLAAAYALIGQKEVANNIVNTTSYDFPPQKYNYYTYGSSDRNKAMVLETFVLMKDVVKARALGKTIAASLSDKRYMSTQTTAYSLLAMAKYAKLIGGKGLYVTVKTNENTTVNMQTSKTLLSRKLTSKNGENSVQLTNKANNIVYVSVLNTGVLPVGKEKVVQRNLVATVSYKTKNGKKINVSKLSQATNFVAEITISNTKNVKVKDVALTEIIPSGWEIVNTRFTDFGSFNANKVDHEDIRDDRSNFYFDLKPMETKTVRVLLNASYLGTYYLPGVQCEAMYDHDYLVRTKGQWVEIVK